MKTILHLDDEDAIRELVAAYLTLQGYRVLSAASRVEALKVIEREKPQLVICDLQLDESDGIRAIEQIKAVLRDVPVILFTGVIFDPSVAATATPKTVNSYVPKTGPLTNLLAEIKRLMPG